MPYIQRITSKGQLVPIVFGQDTVAASQSAAALQVAICEASQINTGYTMPFNYEVVAVSFQLSAAGTAGVFTIDPTVGGTAKTAGRLTVGTAASGYQRTSREKIRGVAGDVLGVKITTDGSWDGTSSDLSVVVWVLLHLDGI